MADGLFNGRPMFDRVFFENSINFAKGCPNPAGRLNRDVMLFEKDLYDLIVGRHDLRGLPGYGFCIRRKRSIPRLGRYHIRRICE